MNSKLELFTLYRIRNDYTTVEVCLLLSAGDSLNYYRPNKKVGRTDLC
jgi:hypothetical protein